MAHPPQSTTTTTGGSSSPALKFRCTFSGTICDAMRRRGWEQWSGDSHHTQHHRPNWSIYFCDMTQFRDLWLSNNHPMHSNNSSTSGHHNSSSNLFPLIGDKQKIGHFRNCQEISRKNLLVKNLKKFKHRLYQSFGKAVADKCDFMPTTFILPSEHYKFLQEFRSNHTYHLHPNHTHHHGSQTDALWIIKPAAGAQGRGIFIFKSLQDYLTWRMTFDTSNTTTNSNYTNNNSSNASVDGTTQTNTNNTVIDDSSIFNNMEQTDPLDQQSQQVQQQPPPPPAQLNMRADTYVVQKYISNPYLIGGRKFDIRFYVLVTSFNPLRFYMYREGFARFSAGQFSLDALQDVYIHLTNVAIQKTSEDYNPEKGSKWSLQSLREYLTARHGRDKVQDLFNTIDMIVIRTLQAAVGLVVSDPHCFEVYGFDVLIDKELTPWLLEVNASPAFTPSNEEDYILKVGLIDDTVTVLDIEGRLTGLEKRVGGYDLLYCNDGPVYANPSDCGNAKGWDGGLKLNSFLGCKNDRLPQLRDLHRTANFLKSTANLLANDNDTFSSNNNGTKGSGSSVASSSEVPSLKMRKGQKDDRFLMPTNNDNSN